MSAARQPRPIVSRPEHPLCGLLQAASRIEPPEGAHERVLQRLLRTQPRRLIEEAAPGDPVATLLADLGSMEPSPTQRARILRSLGPAAKTERRWPIWGAVGLTTAAAVAVLSFPRLETPPPEAPVMATTPSAPKPAEAPSPRRQFLAGLGELVLSDDAQVTVERNDASGARLRLASGRMALNALSRHGRGPLVIASLGVEVTIVGTVLAVDATGPAPVVTVGEGLVEVRHERRMTRVGAGERWSHPNEAVTTATSGWAAWAMQQVGGDRHLQLDDVRDVTPAPPPPPRTDRNRKPRPTTSAPSRAPQEEAFELERLTRPHAKLPAAELSRRVADARTSFDRRAEAVWLRALADASDASALQMRTALVELAKLLDDELALPLEAIEVRQAVAQRFTILRGEARLQIMLAASELGHPKAKSAIEACQEGCDDTARSFARFLLARQLQLDGHLLRAEKAMDTARRDATELGGAERLAELFFLRARHFLHRGQVERAQGAASVCRAFDREGLHTSQLRQQGL